jgi:hypothetical protein
MLVTFRRPCRFVILLLLATGCRDSAVTTPETVVLDNELIVGSYAAVRAAGAPLDLVCYPFPDPPGSGLLGVGVLSIDTVRRVVRRQELRYTGPGGCAHDETITVDHERPYRVAGTHLLIERPVSGGSTVEDTAVVIGQTLVLRSALVDFVYSRVGRSGAVFYAQTSTNSGWMIGPVNVVTGGGPWTMTMPPFEGPRNQVIFLESSSGRPPVGTHNLDATGQPYRLKVARDTPGGSDLFQSVSGTLVISESTAQGVMGTFSATLTASSSSTTLTGKFTAVCSTSC